jgi:hypothetical protein
MKKLSSKSTYFFKRIFPVLWFGFISLFTGLLLFANTEYNGLGLSFLFVPVFLAIIGYFLMKKIVWDLVDEVYDEGESLLFKNNGKQERVGLREIKNISYTTMINPPRVTIALRRNTAFGSRISFTPQTRLIPFRVNPDIEELIDRVDKARG